MEWCSLFLSHFSPVFVLLLSELRSLAASSHSGLYFFFFCERSGSYTAGEKVWCQRHIYVFTLRNVFHQQKNCCNRFQDTLKVHVILKPDLYIQHGQHKMNTQQAWVSLKMQTATRANISTSGHIEFIWLTHCVDMIGQTRRAYDVWLNGLFQMPWPIYSPKIQKWEDERSQCSPCSGAIGL